jgi:HK97 family phage prohead protease
MADTKAPYGTDVSYGDPGYLDADGNQASKSGKPGIKRYPLSADKVEAAWSYINQAKNAGQYTAAQLASIKGRVKAAMAKHGHDVADQPATASRAEYTRLYPLENIEILRSEKDDDGRPGAIVEAYAAVFGQPAEIKDHEGHYIEEIDRSAFDTALSFAARNTGGLPANVKVLYNHGLTVQGTPAPEFQLPIGVPIDIKAEERGLLTRTRYDAEDPFVQRLLGKIRQGSITAQSFVGRIIRSDPSLRRGDVYRPDSAGALRTVRRMKLGLREYGPVLWPAYSGAEILGVRMSTPGGALDPEEEISDAPALPPDGGPAAAGNDPLAPQEHSARYHQHALYAMRSQELREKYGLAW